MEMPISQTTYVAQFSNSSMFDVMDATTMAYVWDNVTNDVMNMTTTEAVTASPRALPLPGLVDKATKDLVVEVVNCYLLPVVFLFGVFGNAMSFVVLVVHGLNTSTNVLLLGVTVSDFCYLVTMFARKVSCIVSKFDFVMSRRLETGLLPTVYMVNRVFGLSTPFLTMLITLERCLAVSKPFKVQKIVTPLRMKVAVVSVFLLATAAIAPFFFIYTIQWYPDRATGEMIPGLAGTPFYYENLDVITAYNNILLAGIFYFGPMIVVVVCTVFILVTIKRSSQWRKATAKGGEKTDERRMTKLLMAVSFVYVTLYIPGGIIGIANQVSPDFGSLGGRYNNLFYLVAALQLLLYAANSSCNFIIYMLLSRKFYSTYVRIFLCRKEGRPGETTKGTSLRSSSKRTGISSATDEPSAIEK